MSYPEGGCPICKKEFAAGDDVVICPQCGAPYHRECFAKTGRCAFEQKHGPDFEYSPPGAARAEGGGAAVRCAACGAANGGDNIFCDKCGAPLHAEAKAAGPQPARPVFAGAVGGEGGPQVNMDGEIDGIPKREWETYIGRSAPAYIYRLSHMQTVGSKVSFMPSAFLFSLFYFAYRKMWGWAVLAAISVVVMVVPQILPAAAGAGWPMPAWLTAGVMNTAANVGYIVGLALRMVFGMFALQLYRRGAVKKIGAARAAASGGLYEDELRRRGGVSVAGAVAAGVLLLAAAFALASAVSEDLLNVVSALL